MTEEIKKEGSTSCICGCSNCSICKCGMASGHIHGYRRHMMMKILVLIIIVLAFILGTQLGELKGELRSYRGSHEMMRGWSNDNNYSGFGMMNGYNQDVTNQSVPTTNPTVTAPTTKQP